MEHSHIQVRGAGVSLEASLSVLSSRAVSNQNIVPEVAAAPLAVLVLGPARAGTAH